MKPQQFCCGFFFDKILKLSAPVLLLQHFRHFLRGFLTATGKPKLDDSVQAVSEEFNMIFQVFGDLLLLCTTGIIGGNEMLIIIAELEVGLIEKLVFLDVAERFQCAAAFVEIIVVRKKIAEIPFQLLTGLISKIEYIQIIGVEGAAVKLRLLDQIGYRNILDLPCLQQFDEGFFDFLLGVFSAFVILRVHINSPLNQQMLQK